jgi:hypothetical protein
MPFIYTFSPLFAVGNIWRLQLMLYSYRRIWTQIFNNQDARSVCRIKSILGWIAFAKRPLKKLELLSALSFSVGNPSITRLVPQYILDICSPLVEERRDSTMFFIHVSVKESVTSSCTPDGRETSANVYSGSYRITPVAGLLMSRMHIMNTVLPP